MAEPDAGEVIGERLRQLALGATAALLAARVYWVSEPEIRVDAGTGMTWVATMLVVTGVALASALIGGKLRLRWSWADAGVIALMVLVGWSASRGLDRRPAINLAWEWGGLGFAYLILRNLPRSRKESKALVGVMAATSVAIAVYGLFQAGVEMPEYKKMFVANREAALGQMGIAPGTPAAALYENRLLGSNEPYATFALANSLAGFLVGPLVLMLGAVLNVMTRRPTTDDGGSKFAAIVLAIPLIFLVLICLLMTKSRSAWIGLTVASVILAYRQWKVVRVRTFLISTVMVLVFLAGLAAVGLKLGRLDKQVATETEKSLVVRLQYWSGSLKIITASAANFWRGVGPGNFVNAYVKVKAAEAGEEVFDPHNAVFEVWTTAGFLAVIALALAIGVGLWNMFRPGSIVEAEPVEVKASKRRDPTAAPRNSAWLVVWGGLGGWVGVVLLGRLNPFLGDLWTRWLVLGAAWLIAAAGGFALWRRPEAINSFVIGAAVVAVVVNLMGAGGIGIPVVAGALWALLALGLNLQEGRPCSVHREVGRPGAFALACVWVAFLGIFVGAVSPYYQAQAAIDDAEAALRATPPAVEKAEAAYQRAAAADRYSARPWLALAALDYQVWQTRGAKPSDLRWRKILVNMLKAVDPPRPTNLWSRHRERARMASLLVKAIGGSVGHTEILILRGKVVEASRAAVLLYPTNASLRAWLAEASAEIGMFPDALKEGREALRLDQLTPHYDKKLDKKVRIWLKTHIPEWEKTVGEAEAVGKSKAN